MAADLEVQGKPVVNLAVMAEEKSDGGRMHAVREMRVRWIVGLVTLAMMAAWLVRAQEQRDGHTGDAGKRQYLVLLKHGPKWLPNKSVTEQPLLEHGHYLEQQMHKGALLMAGPFLDDSGGVIVLSAKDEAEARTIEEHDPGVMSQVLAIESIRSFRIAFDAATGKTPFQPEK